jgi:hypothetical protein
MPDPADCVRLARRAEHVSVDHGRGHIPVAEELLDGTPAERGSELRSSREKKGP